MPPISFVDFPDDPLTAGVNYIDSPSDAQVQ